MTLRLKPLRSGNVSIRTGSPSGPEIGRAEFKGMEMIEVDVPLQTTTGGPTELYFVLEGGAAWVDWIYFRAGSVLSMR